MSDAAGRFQVRDTSTFVDDSNRGGVDCRFHPVLHVEFCGQGSETRSGP